MHKGKYLTWLVLLAISGLNAIAQEKVVSDVAGNTRQEFLDVASATMTPGDNLLDRIQSCDRRIDAAFAAVRADIALGKRRAPLVDNAANGIFVSNYANNVWGATRPELVKLARTFSMFAMDYVEGLQDYLDEMLRNRGFRSVDFSKLEVFFDPVRNPLTVIENTVAQQLEEQGFHSLVFPTQSTIDEASDDDIASFLLMKSTLENIEANRWLAQFLGELSPHSRRVLLSVLYDDYSQSMYTSYMVAPSPSLIADFRTVAVAAHAAKQAGEQVK
jgi:hypothetical protein